MKIISNKEYKEYMKLKSEEKINEFAKRGWRANSLALSFEQVIIYLMKKFKIQEFELNDCYINEIDYLEVEQTPYNEKIIRIKSDKK